MMMAPLAANMPPTPWQTEILAPGIWAGATPSHLTHALLQRLHAVRAGMHVGEGAAIGVERSPGGRGPSAHGLVPWAWRAVPETSTAGAILRPSPSDGYCYNMM